MKCPHCEWPLNHGEVYDWFLAKDFKTCFEWPCPHCKRTIRVETEAIPHFHLYDPLEPSETY